MIKTEYPRLIRVYGERFDLDPSMPMYLEHRSHHWLQSFLHNRYLSCIYRGRGWLGFLDFAAEYYNRTYLDIIATHAHDVILVNSVLNQVLNQ